MDGIDLTRSTVICAAAIRDDAKRRRKGHGGGRRLKNSCVPYHLSRFAVLGETYERLKRGQFKEFENLQELGQILIGLRIARGMTQRELARNLKVDESMVSRDERNEYHGITVERAKKVLDALGVRLITRVEIEPIHAPSHAGAHSQPELVR